VVGPTSPTETACRGRSRALNAAIGPSPRRLGSCSAPRTGGCYAPDAIARGTPTRTIPVATKHSYGSVRRLLPPADVRFRPSASVGRRRASGEYGGRSWFCVQTRFRCGSVLQRRRKGAVRRGGLLLVRSKAGFHFAVNLHTRGAAMILLRLSGRCLTGNRFEASRLDRWSNPAVASRTLAGGPRPNRSTLQEDFRWAETRNPDNRAVRQP